MAGIIAAIIEGIVALTTTAETTAAVATTAETTALLAETGAAAAESTELATMSTELSELGVAETTFTTPAILSEAAYTELLSGGESTIFEIEGAETDETLLEDFDRPIPEAQFTSERILNASKNFLAKEAKRLLALTGITSAVGASYYLAIHKHHEVNEKSGNLMLLDKEHQEALNRNAIFGLQINNKDRKELYGTVAMNLFKLRVYQLLHPKEFNTTPDQLLINKDLDDKLTNFAKDFLKKK